MRLTQMLEQLTAMPEETQSAPEFQKAARGTRSPRRLSVDDLEPTRR
jgi:hypothetical protein